MPDEFKCLQCGSTDSRRASRGLCRPCYTTAYHCVRDGKTTWEELHKLGLVNNYGLDKSEFMKRVQALRAKLNGEDGENAGFVG